MVAIPIVIWQTQLVTQGVWLNVHVMETIEWPLVQQNILVTNPQPTIEITLTSTYYQHVGHEFKKCPFVDAKLKWLLKEFRTFLPHVAMNTPA